MLAHEFPYQQYVDEVWNSHNVNAMNKYFWQDIVIHSASPGIVTGKGIDVLKRLTQSFFDSFPDLHFIVEDTIAQGNKLSVRLLVEGTQLGEYMNVPPTGRKVAFLDFAIYHLKDNKISDVWGLIDQYRLMQQLGVKK